MKENYRINPVFTMPLARRVTAKEGIAIDGEQIPQGTSIAVCNHAFHRNPAVWGSDHNVFRPSRWSEPETNARSRFLMHFGLGGRQCLGKTIATTNIYKLTSSLLSDFEVELVDGVPDAAGVRKEKTVKPGVNDVPELVSVGISELEEPLLVRCKKRTKQSESGSRTK